MHVNNNDLQEHILMDFNLFNPIKIRQAITNIDD